MNRVDIKGWGSAMQDYSVTSNSDLGPLVLIVWKLVAMTQFISEKLKWRNTNRIIRKWSRRRQLHQKASWWKPFMFFWRKAVDRMWTNISTWYRIYAKFLIYLLLQFVQRYDRYFHYPWKIMLIICFRFLSVSMMAHGNVGVLLQKPCKPATVRGNWIVWDCRLRFSNFH